MFLFVAFLVAITFVHSLPLLVFCLFGMGLALGADYPTARMVISESIPSRTRGRLVRGAFGFQSLGALTGGSVGYLILLGESRPVRLALDVRDGGDPGSHCGRGRFFVRKAPTG